MKSSLIGSCFQREESPALAGDSCQRTDLSSEYCGARGKLSGKTGPGKDVCNEDSNTTDGRALTGKHRIDCGLCDADMESESGRQSSPTDLLLRKYASYPGNLGAYLGTGYTRLRDALSRPWRRDLAPGSRISINADLRQICLCSPTCFQVGFASRRSTCWQFCSGGGPDERRSCAFEEFNWESRSQSDRPFIKKIMNFVRDLLRFCAACCIAPRNLAVRHTPKQFRCLPPNGECRS